MSSDDELKPGTGAFGTWPSAPYFGPEQWAGLGRDPMGYQGQLRASGSKIIEPGQTEIVVRWTGQPMRPTPVSLGLAPDPTVQGDGQSVPAANAFDALIFARLRWTVGVAQFEADLDLVRATLGLTIPAATACDLLVVNGSVNRVKFAAIAGTTEGAPVSPPATRTLIEDVSNINPVVLQIPSWAKVLTPMWGADGPVPVRFGDALTTITGPVIQVAAGNGYTGQLYPIPGGASRVIVGPAPVAQPLVPFVFTLLLP